MGRLNEILSKHQKYHLAQVETSDKYFVPEYIFLKEKIFNSNKYQCVNSDIKYHTSEPDP